MKIQRRLNVSIIIPTFNGRDLLAKNLPYIGKILASNAADEVIIVDDGSCDDSAKFVKENYPTFRIIRHKVNRGFLAAVNTGVRSSRGEFSVLLNNDVHPDINFLKKVYPFIKSRNDIFAVSFHEKGYGWAGGRMEDGFIVHTAGSEGKVPHTSFYANAGGAIYRRAVWIEIGGMDEHVYSPYYWDDIDLSYRALKRGYEIYWHPDAYVSPNLSATIGKLPGTKVSRIQERNQLLFIWKNITSANLFRKHLIGLSKRVAKHPGYFVIFLMAISKLGVVLKQRKKEKKEAKVSDEAILSKFADLK